MNIAKTSFIVFASKLVGSALGFVATLFFARTLGAEVLGQYALFLTLIRWLSLAGNIGFSGALTKRMSEDTASDAYATAGTIVIAVLGVFLSVIILILDDTVNAYVGVPIAPLIAVTLLFSLFQSIITSALSGERKVHLTGLLSSIEMIIRSVAQISLIVVGFGLIAMIASYAVTTFIISIGGLALLSTSITIPTREHFKNLYAYAKFSWLSGLKSESFQSVDIFLLGVFLQPSLVGIYSAAWTVTQFLALFDSAVSSTLFPEISRFDAEDNQRTVVNLVEQSLTYSGLILIPGLFGGILIGERLMRIYGPEFIQGGSVLWILILSMLLYSYKKQLLNALNGLDQPKKTFQINAVFIGTNVILNILLIPPFSVAGAAIASALSVVVGMILSTVSLRSEIDFSIPFGEIFRQFTAAIVMTGVVIGTETAMESLIALNHNHIIVLSLVTVGTIVYFVTLFGISAQFRSTVITNMPI